MLTKEPFFVILGSYATGAEKTAMTIAMIGHKGLPAKSGGVERHVEELSAAFVRRGMSVISFDRHWYVGDEEMPEGVTRRWSYGIRSKHLDAITHTLTAIVLAMKDKPDVIHVHGVGPSLLLPLARVLHPSARIVSTFHCTDRKHTKWGGFARVMLRLGEGFSCWFAHRTIAVSDALAAYCLSEYGCQSTVIPNGVRMAEGAVSDSPVITLNVQPKRYFLMATRLVPHKNVHVAMEAHRLFAERRPDLAVSFPLVIAGGSSWTDAYANDIRRFAAGMPSIRLVGEQHGIALRSLQAHAACHLSVALSEGMSISLLEAGAYARPAIISDIPENIEVTGDLMPRVAPGDAQALSDAMECAALLTDAERDESGAKLAARVRERHDWDNIAEQTLDIYNEAADLQTATVTA